MGIVEADYKFLWTFAGLPGSLNDAGTIFPYRYYMHIWYYNTLIMITKKSIKENGDYENL